MTRRNCVIISHNDLDGYAASTVIAVAERKKGGNILEVLNLRYDQVQTEIIRATQNPDVDVIYIADLSINVASAEMLDNSGKELHLYDHHPASVVLSHQYPWMAVEAIGGFGNGNADIGTSAFSGTSIAVRELFGPQEALVWLVGQTVTSWDLFLWTHDETSQLSRMAVGLNGMFNTEKTDKSAFVEYLTDALLSGHKANFIELCLKQKDIYDKKVAASVEGTVTLAEFVGAVDGYRYRVVSIPAEYSAVARRILVTNTTVDILVIPTEEEVDVELTTYKLPSGDTVVLPSTGERGVSFRCLRDDIKVNDIVAKFDGGGHPKAAGFSATKLAEFYSYVGLTPAHE